MTRSADPTVGPSGSRLPRDPTLDLEFNALTGATRKDRLRIAMLLVRGAGRRLRRALAAPGRVIGRVRIHVPDRLLIAPQDIRTSDPTSAADIGAGYFAFGGKIVNAMQSSPFVLEPSSNAWARQLAGFGWLRHLRAADSTVVRARGRVLVEDFLAAYGKPGPQPAWEPRVTARRVLAWLSQSPIILDGADRGFYNRFMQGLARHRVELENHLAGGNTGEDRLIVALALAEYGLCVDDGAALQRRGTEALASEIAAQILPDGGHIGRNPQILIELLLDLLPLRQAYAARGIQAPAQVLNAIDRVMPMLRLFRHGDGSLALFNGMGQTAPELVATILTYDDARAQPINNARYSGYQRLEGGSTIVVVDVGAAPPQVFSGHAHAGCLSFELSSGSRRLVINCGGVDGGRAKASMASRTTAAHSTLVVDDTSSCRFASGAGLERLLGDQIVSGPVEVTNERTNNEGRMRLVMSHDGYRQRFGLIHHRTLILTDDGTILDGFDRLLDAGKTGPSLPYALRFHLHPSVKARAYADGSAVRLETPDEEAWIFQADAEIFVEPSILFAAAGGPRPTLQIKVSANTGSIRDIRWTFQRISSGGRRR